LFNSLFLISILILSAGCESRIQLDEIESDSYVCKDCNIILISIDALRADHLGIYGYHRDTSPFLDTFAEENILFENYFTVIPKTGPSFTTLFTGKYPGNHGVLQNRLVIGNENTMLAEVLQSKYQTYAIIGNPTLNTRRGYSKGFDEFTSFLNTTAKRFTADAIAWTENKINKEEPFFLWIHYLDPHGPYAPPKQYKNLFVDDPYYNESKEAAIDYEPIEGLNQNFIRGAIPKYQRLEDINKTDYYISQYDAEIRTIDQEISRLMQSLDRQGLSDDSIIIITSDHGESLDENNYYFEHGNLVNEGSIHIPLIIKLPGSKNSKKIDSILQNTDLFQTLLHIIGYSTDIKTDGMDFTDALINSSNKDFGRKFIYSRSSDAYLTIEDTIRFKDTKFVRNRSIEPDSEYEYFYYDNINDETQDINSIDMLSTDKINELIGLFPKLSEIESKNSKKAELDDKNTDLLKSLGYMN